MCVSECFLSFCSRTALSLSRTRDSAIRFCYLFLLCYLIRRFFFEFNVLCVQPFPFPPTRRRKNTHELGKFAFVFSPIALVMFQQKEAKSVYAFPCVSINTFSVIFFHLRENERMYLVRDIFVAAAALCVENGNHLESKSVVVVRVSAMVCAYFRRLLWLWLCVCVYI